jgi:hypothetical protein
MSIVPFLSQTSFDPQITDILASAFDIAWQRIQNSGSPLVTGDAAAATRETLARTIIAVAQTGERDKNRLVESALSRLALDPSAAQTRPSGEEASV